jgi:hypothetical protein
VLGHLSRDCNTPELARGAVQTLLSRTRRTDVEIFCADQRDVSPCFHIGDTPAGAFQPTFDHIFFGTTPRVASASRAA